MVDALKAKDYTNLFCLRIQLWHVRALERNINIYICLNIDFTDIYMQKDAHFTIFCSILLIGLSSKIQENFANTA